MAPKKRGTRAAQLQPQPAPSDYETDTANVTDSAVPIIAPPPTRTNTQLNLLVLRRYVPDIQAIICIAPFAVVYAFAPESEQWEKSGVEGTLFVCQRSSDKTSTSARYNAVILNRKGLDNFIVDLVSGEHIEITEQYVIIQVMGDDGTPLIYGLWIFSEPQQGSAISTKDIVANKIQECAVRAEQSRMNVQAAENNHLQHSKEHDIYHSSQAQSEELKPERQALGQQIDVQSLFARPAVATSHTEIKQPAPQQVVVPATAFAATPDTDFFRNPHSQAMAQQPPRQTSGQQNALLSLFRTAPAG